MKPPKAPTLDLSVFPAGLAITALPPYSGNSATCIKCGNVGASTKYTERPVTRVEGGVSTTRTTECQRRECSNCGYPWNEATITPAPQEAE